MFALKREVIKAYLLRAWSAVTYTYESAILRYLKSCTLQPRPQRLLALEKLAQMLVDHLKGILNYCHFEVSFGVVQAIQRQYRNSAADGATTICAVCSSRPSAWSSPRPNRRLQESRLRIGLPVRFSLRADFP